MNPLADAVAEWLDLFAMGIATAVLETVQDGLDDEDKNDKELGEIVQGGAALGAKVTVQVLLSEGVIDRELLLGLVAESVAEDT